MVEVLIEAMLDAVKMLPFLLAVYLIIEFTEHRAFGKLQAFFSNDRFDVVGAAVLGLFPQCGFSVAAANLFAGGMISAGALLAVFIATSDEAIPIFLSSAGSLKWLFWLLGIKFFYAIIVGSVMNLFFKSSGAKKSGTAARVVSSEDSCGCNHCGCGSHGDHDGGHSGSWFSIVKSAVYRTLSIFLFILATNVILNIFIYFIGEDKLSALLMTGSFIQPFIAALIGLIPNCAASVVLSDLFLSGALSFGSLTAGLCAGAGVALPVLFRVNRNTKQNFALLGFLYAFSVLIGVIIQLIV